MFDFSIVTNWIHEMLLSVMPEGWAIFIECIAVGVCIVALYAILAIVLIYMERCTRRQLFTWNAKSVVSSSAASVRTVSVNGVLFK